MEQAKRLLEVKNLKKYFRLGGRTLRAVDDVSFFINRGETLGLVGESGSGKTTCGRTCIGIYGRTGGEVLFDGRDVHRLRGAEKRAFSRRAQIVFQDPYASLDPRMRVGDLVAEGLRAHHLCSSRGEERRKVQELLRAVGLEAEHAARTVHEFSGGQRQRIGIARALAVGPEFLVCDEPISALDVSIQAQIVNLLMRLQKELSLTCLFIAHDLSMVKHISNRVAVLYLGTLVEMTDSESLYRRPLHPYTRALLSAIPIPDPIIESRKKRIKLLGDPPNPLDPPEGCPFSGRCGHVLPLCKRVRPVLEEREPGHFVACHLSSIP